MINTLIAILRKLQKSSITIQCDKLQYLLRYYMFIIEKNMDFILSYNDIITILLLYLITIKLYYVFNFLYDIIRKFNFYNIKKKNLIHLSTKEII